MITSETISNLIMAYGSSSKKIFGKNVYNDHILNFASYIVDLDLPEGSKPIYFTYIMACSGFCDPQGFVNLIIEKDRTKIPIENTDLIEISTDDDAIKHNFDVLQKMTKEPNGSTLDVGEFAWEQSYDLLSYTIFVLLSTFCALNDTMVPFNFSFLNVLCHAYDVDMSEIENKIKDITIDIKSVYDDYFYGFCDAVKGFGNDRTMRIAMMSLTPAFIAISTNGCMIRNCQPCPLSTECQTCQKQLMQN